LCARLVISRRKKFLSRRPGRATWQALGEGCEHPVSNPADKPPKNVGILVDLEKLTLTVMEGDLPFKQYPVAAGKPSTPSPIGEWKIISKEFDWGGAFGARWMGLNVPWGNYGLHGTNRPWSIGSPVSAGCIRMFNEDIIQVFEWVPVGTSVKIKAPLTWLAGSGSRTLKNGLCGPDVVYLQLLLKETGFNPYYCDGWYGALTELAVRTYQLHTGLPISGQVDEKTRHHLEEKASVFETQNQ
jgi:L,D-transpeptidase ErfK/SrfK